MVQAYGNLINRVMENYRFPTPEVGSAATLTLWSDRHAATVIAVEDVKGKTYVTVQRDNAKMISGSPMDGSADYEYSPNPRGAKHTYRLEDGVPKYVIKNEMTGRWNLASGNGIIFGTRDEYYDPSF